MFWYRNQVFKNIKKIYYQLSKFKPRLSLKASSFKSLIASRFKLSQRFIGVFLLVFGLVLFLSPVIYKKYIAIKDKEIKQEQEDSSFQVASLGNLVETGPVKIDQDLLNRKFSLVDLPKRIIIPSRSIDLPVKTARVIDNAWELSDDSASFGLGSATPGSGGNTVIFAHAKRKLFRPLRGIKKNSRIYILTSKQWHVYEVVEIKTVLSSEIEVIEPTKEETLTLFTCTGFADTKRLIVVAKLINP